jgi:hypothetical protein
VPPFEEMEKDGTHDMFCPFGQNRMILIHGLMDGERDEDEDETDLTPDVIILPPSDLDVDPDAMFEPDAKDLAAKDLAAAELASLKHTSLKHEAYLITDKESGGNTRQHKSSVLQIFSSNEPSSQDGLVRIQSHSRFDKPGHGFTIGSAMDPEEPTFSVQDPAAMLVRSKNSIWLALVQLVDLKLDERGTTLALPICLINELNVRIKVQIMCVLRVLQGQEIDKGDWEWTGHFKRHQAHLQLSMSKDTGCSC